MAPKKRTTRATPATTTTPTTTVTNAQLQALIDRGIAAALAERDADRSTNGDNNNDSGTGERRQMATPRECSYTNFLKCQPMSFQSTEGVMGLTRWAAGIRMRALLPSTSRRTDIPEADMPPRKRACLTAPTLEFEIGESSAAAHVRTLKTQVAALITQTTSMQTQLTTTLGRIEVLEARDPEPYEGPAEAGSNC
nr:hypothetical protein [Tanacetum cinerariifolium]